MPRQKTVPPTQLHQVSGSGDADAGVGLTLRVRHPDGTDRLSLRATDELSAVRAQIAQLKSVEPVARVQLFRDIACTDELDDDDGVIGPRGVGLSHGDMIHMRIKPAPKAKRPANTDGGSAASPAKRPKAAARRSGGEYLSEGKNAHAIAVNYLLPDARTSGEAAYSQMSAAARCDAVEHKRVELTVSKRGQKSVLHVAFTGNRKGFEERTPCYSREEIVAVLAEIISRQTTSSRRAASSGTHLLNAPEMARRSPPLFWSVYRLVEDGGAFEQALEGLVAAARAATDAPETKPEPDGG